jgi:hypothetical protein
VIRSFAPLALLAGLALSAPTPAQAGPPEGVKIEKKVKSKHVEKLFLGRWLVELPPEAERALKIARIALAGGDDIALEAMNPTEEERATYQMIQLAIAMGAADDPSFKEMIDSLDTAGSISFDVRDRDMELKMGDESTLATWSTVRADNNLLVISTAMPGEAASEVEVHFVSRDRVLLWNNTDESFYLNRVK